MLHKTKGLLLSALTVIFTSLCSVANEPLSLDSCRNMALRNNKTMQIAQERLKAAEYQKKEAFAAYLPGFDFTGTYFYNQKEISLLSGDQMLPTQSFNPQTGQFEYPTVSRYPHRWLSFRKKQ